jgi:hypothetical protein
MKDHLAPVQKKLKLLVDEHKWIDNCKSKTTYGKVCEKIIITPPVISKVTIK